MAKPDASPLTAAQREIMEIVWQCGEVTVAEVRDALSAKRSNLQVAIGAFLPYGDSHMHARGILEVIAGVWVGCKPWLTTILVR